MGFPICICVVETNAVMSHYVIVVSISSVCVSKVARSAKKMLINSI